MRYKYEYHEYEYELDRTPIDVINGGPALRTWVDNHQASLSDFLQQIESSANRWLEERREFLLY